MPETQYDVRAQLTMSAQRAHGQMRALSGEVRNLGALIKGGTSSAASMFSQLTAVGSTYLGLRAVSGAFRSLIGGAVSYTANLEKTKIGLQSVIQGVENTSWETAGKRAEAAFQKIRDMAIVSPATSEEMFSIFQGIVGPIESAGFSMQKVLDITNKTTLAASALNVDYSQASRDISLMARGSAGMDVKMFSILRSMGAIKEDAEAWNKTLTGAQRVEKLDAALSKFASSGKAFGSSWVGVTSSFKDIVDNFKGAAFSPIMKRVGQNLERFNGYMLEHRAQIEAFMSTVGNDVAKRLQTLFDRAQVGFQYILAHWGEIVSRFDHVVAKVKEVAPVLAKAAIAWQAVQLGRNVVGGAVGAVGTGMEIASVLRGGAAGRAVAAAATPVVQVAQAAMIGSSPFGLMGGASGVAGATTSGAGAVFGMMGGGTGTAAGGAGTAAAGAGVAAGGVALAPILLAIAAALAVFLAIALAVKDQWGNMSVIFGETFGSIATMVIGLGKSMWNFLAPVFKMLGSVLLVPLSAGFQILSVLFRGLLVVLTPIFDVLGLITNAVWGQLKPAFDWIFGMISKFSSFMNGVFGEIDTMRKERDKDKAMDEAARTAARLREQQGVEHEDTYAPLMGPALFNRKEQEKMGGVDLNALAKGQVNVNQDFRGSRINVRQDFKGNTDPDRVVQAMMRDLTRQAESRVSSGFAGALTR